MELIRAKNEFPEWLCRGAVTIGNFDGVHRGHARIIEQLTTFANQVNGKSIVLSFDPPPAKLLATDDIPAPLSWAERKAELFAKLNVDALILYPTDHELLTKTPTEFFNQIICQQLQAAALVEGPNFFYGRNRTGNVKTLAQSCADAQLLFKVVEPLEQDNTMISSSRIRTAISGGAIELANQWLTQPYRIRGTVSHGAGRGSKIGFPTANLHQIDTLLPSEGIYAGQVFWKGKHFQAAIHIGTNPTFDEKLQKVEVFILDFDHEIYGEQIEVEFLLRLRDIVRFDSVAELVQQLKQDVEQVRHFFISTD